MTTIQIRVQDLEIDPVEMGLTVDEIPVKLWIDPGQVGGRFEPSWSPYIEDFEVEGGFPQEVVEAVGQYLEKNEAQVFQHLEEDNLNPPDPYFDY